MPKRPKGAAKPRHKKSATRSKNSFLRKLSYDLRTPLNSITGFAELLKSKSAGTINKKQKEYLNDISMSAQRLLQVISEGLDRVVIRSGGPFKIPKKKTTKRRPKEN